MSFVDQWMIIFLEEEKEEYRWWVYSYERAFELCKTFFVVYVFNVLIFKKRKADRGDETFHFPSALCSLQFAFLVSCLRDCCLLCAFVVHPSIQATVPGWHFGFTFPPNK